MTISLPGTAALKEWAIAVHALAQGQTILLLRKGGLREPSGRFALAHSVVWLYPTYEHQKPQWLKPDYADQVQPVPTGWHPDIVPLTAWAEITHSIELRDADVVAALSPFHIWTDAFVTERLKWSGRSPSSSPTETPLSVLLLRTYALTEPGAIAYDPRYGGCKSWTELREPIPAPIGQPVLSDSAYAHRIAAIEQAIGQTLDQTLG